MATMDYLKTNNDDTADRMNKTIEVSDSSFNESLLKNQLTDNRPVTQQTLHKTTSPPKFQARMTVAGDESNDEDQVDFFDDTTEATSHMQSMHNATSVSKHTHGQQPSQASIVAFASSVDPMTPRCKTCSMLKEYESSDGRTNLSGLTSHSEDIKVKMPAGVPFKETSENSSNGVKGVGWSSNYSGSGQDTSATIQSLELRENILVSGAECIDQSEVYHPSKKGSPPKAPLWEQVVGRDASRRREASCTGNKSDWIG